MQPSAHQVTIAVLWIRYTLMTAEMLNFIDNSASNDCDETIAQKVDAFCLQLEELMDEFGVEPLMNAKETKYSFRCLLADHIMNIFVTIIGMKRLVTRTIKAQVVDAITVRAARKVVSIILDFNTVPDPSIPVQRIFDQYVSIFIRSSVIKCVSCSLSRR